MLPDWIIFVAAISYLFLLFAVASYGDRRANPARLSQHGRPVVFALSLAIYCTSWTYYGSVGLASQRGWEFAAIYIGPILMFTLGMPVLKRIIELAKAEKITSAADFMAARYGKNPRIAAIVALISLVGGIPYIALQLKAISSSVTAMVSASGMLAEPVGISFSNLPLLVTAFLAFFAIIFGTRHTDATEHQDGLILAIAMETVVKLVAFATAGIYVVFFLFDGPQALWDAASTNEAAMAAFNHETSISRWILLVALSAIAIVVLPRQFHVTVVENRTMGELRMAGILLPLYLVAINIFVLPVAFAGLVNLGPGTDADLYILTLPLQNGMPVVSLITFIGGFSAATAMVIVASVALAIMISNDIVLPVYLRKRLAAPYGQSADYTRFLLRARRTAIFSVLLLGYAYYRSTDETAALASIGLLSFAAIAQIAPPLFGGLIWHQANSRGAIIGMLTGFGIWGYFLFLPSLGFPDHGKFAGDVLATFVPGTDFFDGPDADQLVNITLLSLLANLLGFVVGSLSRSPRPLERIQASVFIRRQADTAPLTRGWKNSVTVGDLKSAVARYLGAERMLRSFTTYERQAGRSLSDLQPADMAVVNFSEQLLGSAIGSSSARLVLSLMLQRLEDTSSDAARLLDQASEALQHNQDMLHTALSQMDQGIAVFDTSNELMIWNRRFRTLMELPEDIGQVGMSLHVITDLLARRGDVSSTGSGNLLSDFLVLDQPFSLTLNGKDRIVEVRTNAMPGKGIVTTYTDITQQVAADRALKQINETLEHRVVERTAELTRVNHELADARAAAEEANIGKTRFFAAAGHDILQPLNAARLYSSALVERMGETPDSELVKNIDYSLESVENILGAVLDISRLDTGAMRPRYSTVDLKNFLARIETDFAPIASEKNLKLVVVPSSLQVRTDSNLLRRLVQNLVSNAIKYTPSGKVLVGVRRRGDQAVIQVMDSGIGIPQSKFRTIFKEFARLDEGVKTAAGLGLGLSIVDRIARVLNCPVELSSEPGRGTEFRVLLPVAAGAARPVETVSPKTGEINKALLGLRVLCIDNEAAILDGMQKLLSGWGCSVSTAGSIGEAVDVSQKSADRPHVIIADFHLDDGTGIEAIGLIRKHWNSELPALLATADRSQEVRALAEANQITIQNKPIKPAGLRAWLSHTAAQQKMPAE